jgi:hypothetical protein
MCRHSRSKATSRLCRCIVCAVCGRRGGRGKADMHVSAVSYSRVDSTSYGSSFKAHKCQGETLHRNNHSQRHRTIRVVRSPEVVPCSCRRATRRGEDSSVRFTCSVSKSSSRVRIERNDESFSHTVHSTTNTCAWTTIRAVVMEDSQEARSEKYEKSTDTRCKQPRLLTADQASNSHWTGMFRLPLSLGSMPMWHISFTLADSDNTYLR